MLVVTRRVGEGLALGGQVTVKVLAIEGGKVRLGVEAPPTVAVQRLAAAAAPPPPKPRQ